MDNTTASQPTFHSTSIIGLSKNAGKTTLLNYIIQTYDSSSGTMGLISIGVDGESEDMLSGKQKPLITIPEGTLVATTTSGLLEGTAKWRILEKTSIRSSIGDVYIAKAVQEGTVKLVGTPMLDHIIYVFDLFHKYGVHRAIVDGAYDRLSSATPYLTDETYLVIGASLQDDERLFWKKVKERLFPFFYPQVKDETILSMVDKWSKKDEIMVKQDGEWSFYPSTYLLTNGDFLEREVEWLLLPGVLTEKVFTSMLRKKKAWHIVLQHGLKSFVSSELVERWRKKGGTIQVLRPICIKGIIYNPYSPAGYAYSGEKMKQRIQQMVNNWSNEEIPIFNVWNEEVKGDECFE